MPLYFLFYRMSLIMFMDLLEIFLNPLLMLVALTLILAIGYHFSGKEIFSSMLVGYLGVLIGWIIYGTVDYALNLLFADNSNVLIVLRYLLTISVMFIYFKLFTKNLKLAGILASSVVLLTFVLPYSLVKTLKFIKMDGIIEMDLIYLGIIFGMLVTGLLWGIILYKAR